MDLNTTLDRRMTTRLSPICCVMIFVFICGASVLHLHTQSFCSFSPFFWVSLHANINTEVKSPSKSLSLPVNETWHVKRDPKRTICTATSLDRVWNTCSHFRRSDTEIKDLIKVKRGAPFHDNTRTRIACAQLSTGEHAGEFKLTIHTY